MGPGFVHPGNVPVAHRITVDVNALQWGPGLYTREIGHRRGLATTVGGLNGARVCTPGKLRETGALKDSDRGRASMGPGFVHPGNLAEAAIAERAGAASMGPGFVHPGNHRARPVCGAAGGASMGPGFVHPGNGCCHASRPRTGALQWGPGLYTREIGADRPGVRRSAGFNGARVCTPGKCARPAPAGALGAPASMGPGFVHPGNARCARTRRPGLWGRFNGARVCTPGKFRRHHRARVGRPRFNGARVCTPGKWIGTGGGASVPAPLQWGPGLYTREIGTRRDVIRPRRRLQWGPGLYTREIELHLAGVAPHRSASMGPGFVHPGNTGR